MSSQNVTTKKSDFFTFEKNIHPMFQIYKGWNKSIVIKFNLKKYDKINTAFFSKYFRNIVNKEKILVVVSGNIEIKKNEKKISLSKFDALNFFSLQKNFSISCSSKSIFFLISSTNVLEKKCESVYFNFKKDIVAKDIWGGQCLSRPYVGKNLNLVLFELKPGFKFNDTGHLNEQITWLINGSMEFYCDKLKKKLTSSNGVDIGPNHPHGGISNGAEGFDAFFPKRSESIYGQSIKIKKF